MTKKRKPKPQKPNHKKPQKPIIVQSKSPKIRVERLPIIKPEPDTLWCQIKKKLSFLNTITAKVIGVVMALFTLYQINATVKQNKEENRTVVPKTGILFPELDLRDRVLYVKYGGTVYDTIQFSAARQNRTLDIFRNLNGGSGLTFTLKLDSQNNLHLSGIFRNLDGKLIGQIKDNRWVILKSPEIEYGNDNDKLEIVDEERNVMLQLLFKKPDTLELMGYDVSDQAITVANDSGFFVIALGEVGKKSARNLIKNIKPIFKY